VPGILIRRPHRSVHYTWVSIMEHHVQKRGGFTVLEQSWRMGRGGDDFLHNDELLFIIAKYGELRPFQEMYEFFFDNYLGIPVKELLEVITFMVRSLVVASRYGTN